MFELLLTFGIIGAIIIMASLVFMIIGLVLLAIDWLFKTHFGRKAVKQFVAFLTEEEYYGGA